ncbi:hypothetical protein DFH06DRAFT_761951 [Mycena polygramma]|nr:hypothetical protein DFH06DRAFT_761951 [Mycena polygramma]
MSDITIGLRTFNRDHWAQAQVLAGGDTEFPNATNAIYGVCQQSSGHDQLDAESPIYHDIFSENEDNGKMRTKYIGHETKTLTPAQPYADFELHVPHGTPVDFESYYSNPENYLYFRLGVQYSLDVARCIYPGRVEVLEETTDEAAKTEEGLWDRYTRVGAPVESPSLQRTLGLQTLMPITVVSGVLPSHELVHYLTPGSPAPVLRRGAQAEMPTWFPLVEPVFAVEALVNTSARLLLPGTADPAQRLAHQSRSRHLDPTRYYHRDTFAGMLWKKKIVAEQRGILPLRSQASDKGDGQQTPFRSPSQSEGTHVLTESWGALRCQRAPAPPHSRADELVS